MFTLSTGDSDSSVPGGDEYAIKDVFDKKCRKVASAFFHISPTDTRMKSSQEVYSI
jgi:hypothetical protein